MATREIYNAQYPLVAFDTQLVNSDTTTNGNIIDTANYDGGILFAMQAGVVTLGDATPLIHDGDDSGLSDAAVVADKNIVPVNIGGTWYETGQEAASIIDTTNDILTIGVVGTKRYVRLSFVSANSADMTIGAGVFKVGELQSVYGL